MSDFVLFRKLMPAVQRLHQHYGSKSELDLSELLRSSLYNFESETEYSYSGDGAIGHDILMFIPAKKLNLVDLDEQDRISEQIRDDLNKVLSSEVENEFVRAVHIRMVDENDPKYQNAVPFSGEPYVCPKDVGLWKDNALRLFLSHRDQYKSYARELANELEPYGISVFVAHDAIKPMKEWQNEVLNGLKTMEVMLVLRTDDFHKSFWTNQEIGFALGRGIPIICVKVGTTDPEEFTSSRQALKASLENIVNVSPKVCRALFGEIDQEERLKEVLIEAFLSSNCFSDTIASFERLKAAASHLNESELNRIIEGYACNDQLYGCAGIRTSRNSLKQYLEDATGKSFEIRSKKIVELAEDEDIDIPF